ncbi:Oxidoreductase OXR1 [Penicillium diatomitis]|uniref:Oxidoreductase OXR1 n=1 Tax=Penicillium diatomitis TaxID=2819901 RepID=A0A9X0BYI8_9EURO|nr:Oxidoreductase OXR1 [Penicillium diatomitis]KAJ5490721.1 Oxidoreductase OXR1 [Penicillium diatomitis]
MKRSWFVAANLKQLQSLQPDSRRHLGSFRKVNRACYDAATPILFGVLTLRFSDMTSLRAAVAEITETPEGQNSLRWARRLHVAGDARAQGYWWHRIERLEPWAVSLASEDRPTVQDTLLDHWLTAVDPIPHRRPTIVHTSHACDWSWEPVLSLIARLSHLKQIDFSTQGEVTVGVEDIVSRYHPACEVSVFSAQVVERSLGNTGSWHQFQGPNSTEAFRFNIEWLRRPRLNTLTVGLGLYGREEQPVVEMYAFLVNAPGLKHLEVFGLHRRDDGSSTALLRLKQQWQDLQETSPPGKVCNLESITISGSALSEEIVLSFAAAGNLSNLRSLILAAPVLDWASLARVAQHLPRLEGLFFELNSTKFLPSPDLVDAIRAFRPLRYLSVGDLGGSENLRRVVEIHGPSLEGLMLCPVDYARYTKLNASDLIHLSAHCPNLRQLRVQAKRSMGTRPECEMYRALSMFPKLHSLVLDLHFDARPESQAHGLIAADTTTLRECFINAATDESLATAIWQLIKSTGAPRLQFMRIVPVGNHRFSREEAWLLARFARSFLVTRYNLNNPELPLVEEIGRREPTRRARPGWVQSDGRLAQLLQTIWPRIAHVQDWWNSGWQSFPLALNA